MPYSVSHSPVYNTSSSQPPISPSWPEGLTAPNMGSRGGRRGNNDQQGGLQRQNTGPRDGNTAPQQGRRGGAGRGQNPNKPTENTTNGPAVTNRNESKRSDAAAAPAQEEHIPVNDFNAQEVRVGLKNTSEVKPAIYKPAEKAAPAARSGSPWASKRTCYYHSFQYVI